MYSPELFTECVKAALDGWLCVNNGVIQMFVVQFPGHVESSQMVFLQSTVRIKNASIRSQSKQQK